MRYVQRERLLQAHGVCLLSACLAAAAVEALVFGAPWPRFGLGLIGGVVFSVLTGKSQMPEAAAPRAQPAATPPSVMPLSRWLWRPVASAIAVAAFLLVAAQGWGLGEMLFGMFAATGLWSVLAAYRHRVWTRKTGSVLYACSQRSRRGDQLVVYRPN